MWKHEFHWSSRIIWRTFWFREKKNFFFFFKVYIFKINPTSANRSLKKLSTVLLFFCFLNTENNNTIDPLHGVCPFTGSQLCQTRSRFTLQSNPVFIHICDKCWFTVKQVSSPQPLTFAHSCPLMDELLTVHWISHTMTSCYRLVITPGAKCGSCCGWIPTAAHLHSALPVISTPPSRLSSLWLSV